jgi:hypothetical protein
VLRDIELEGGGNKCASPSRKTTTQGLWATILAEKRQVILKGGRHTALFAQSSVLSTQSLFFLIPETKKKKKGIEPKSAHYFADDLEGLIDIR